MIDVVAKPILNDPDLKVETIVEGLDFPTSMAFLGPDDILALEKNTGMVKRIVNGTVSGQPIIDVNVANDVERGMLGIAVSHSDHDLSHDEDQNSTNLHYNKDNHTYVFLYYTESRTNDGEDISNDTQKGTSPLGNRLYRYESSDNKLVNPKMLLDLPAIPEPRHNGGVVMIGPDSNVYTVIGNVNDKERRAYLTESENYEKGKSPDGRAGILRITQDGMPVVNSILGNTDPVNKYYAYGIRNSFGMDFDPVTGNLWDTENGPSYGDEINLVEPGFNSGWSKVQGIWERRGGSPTDVNLDPQKYLTKFDGKGKYSAPEFIWYNTVGPTALKFLESNKLGTEYQNDMFVGDINNGFVYHFDLNKNRTELLLNGVLQDKIANERSELAGILFGQGFDGGITDLEVSPYDGYLYMLTAAGSIYRIVHT
jgi:glucose/arabinose dehydrogenase